MDRGVFDFVEEICRILQYADAEIQHLRSPETESLPLPVPDLDDDIRRKVINLFGDEEHWDVVIRLTRKASTAVVFHILTLLDERKELGEGHVQPRLVLTRNAQEIPVPSFLHEILGDAMENIGMDIDEWW